MSDCAGHQFWRCTLSAVVTALLVSAQATAGAPPLGKVETIHLNGSAGPLDHLAVDHKRSRLLVANQSNNTLDVVDLKRGKLIKQIPDQKQIHGIAYAADLDRVYVGTGDGACKALDPEDYTVLNSRPVADADNVRYDPRSQRVYVAGEKELAVFDGKSLEPVG